MFCWPITKQCRTKENTTYFRSSVENHFLRKIKFERSFNKLFLFNSGKKLDREDGELDILKHGQHFYILVHNYKVCLDRFQFLEVHLIFCPGSTWLKNVSSRLRKTGLCHGQLAKKRSLTNMHTKIVSTEQGRILSFV